MTRSTNNSPTARASRLRRLTTVGVSAALGLGMSAAALAMPAGAATQQAAKTTNSAPVGGLADVATSSPRAARAHTDHEPATPATHPNQVAKIERTEAKLDRKSGVGEAGANASSTDYMKWKNGYVQTAPRVYLLFWGSSFWGSQDSYGVRSRLTNFYNGIGGTVWGGEMKEYKGYAGAFTNPASVLKGSAYDSTAVPSHPSQNDVQSAAIRARRYFNDYGYNTQFVVVLPSGHIDQVSQGGACGWHYWGNDSGYGFTFTSLPYGPDFGTGCGNYRVNNSILDGTTIVAGHEYGETVTDPYGNGWQDSTGITGENGDKCAWLNLRNAHFANGSFPVQPLWSNYYRQYYGSGCLYPSGY